MYLDLGVGGFLANVRLAVTLGEQSGPGIGTGQNPNPAWAVLAPQFNGKNERPRGDAILYLFIRTRCCFRRA
jgi:hypothetical protein